MADKKNNQAKLRWHDILHRYAGSGLSIRRFCAKERISQASFYAWRRKLRGERRPRIPSRGMDESGNGREFVPLTLSDATSVMEVVHPLGYRVRVAGEVDIHALQRVLDALDGRSNQ